MPVMDASASEMPMMDVSMPVLLSASTYMVAVFSTTVLSSVPIGLNCVRSTWPTVIFEPSGLKRMSTSCFCVSEYSPPGGRGAAIAAPAMPIEISKFQMETMMIAPMFVFLIIHEFVRIAGATATLPPSRLSFT